jgi:DNA repair exonuclease SbcCD ATPase subunit
LRPPGVDSDPVAADASAGSPLLSSHERFEARRRERRRRLVVRFGTVLAFLLVLGVAGVASFLALSNRDRADRWAARTALLEKNVAALNHVLVSRTRVLNLRVRQMNRLAAKVEQGQAALSQSQGDVLRLEQRQRELANEKAQVEDQRQQLATERDALAAQKDALTSVASAFIQCNSGLSNALQAVAYQDYSWLSTYGTGVAADCANANSALANYNASYPGG